VGIRNTESAAQFSRAYRERPRTVGALADDSAVLRVACRGAKPLISTAGLDRFPIDLRCHVGRDYDPVQGQWYEDLEENEIFQVLSVDPDEEIVEIIYENGDTEEIDLDTWHELDLEKATEPEGWANDKAAEGEEKDKEEEVEEDDDDWDEDEDDDDWDDDDDDDDLDDDYSDRDS
jgi:hypothetical protein